MAINNPLLEDATVKGARGVLINITGGPDLTLFEVEEAADRIREEVDPDANIIFGTAMDESMKGRMRISVVATGIDAATQRKRPPLTVVGGDSASSGLVPQQQPSAYMPTATPAAPQPATLQSRVMGGLFAPAAPAQHQQQAQAQVQQQGQSGQVRAATTASAQPQSAAPFGGMTNFYSGMTAEQVGNTLRAPVAEEQVARAPQAQSFSNAPVRGLRQGDQFVAPAPVQAPRQQAPMSAPQVPLQGLMPLDAPPAARKMGFGERMMGKVKKLVSQLDAEDAPQASAPSAPQPRAGYEVSHGGARAGLPPVADAEIDIPSFLRRQAN
jgi:cell division protein FtsZ